MNPLQILLYNLTHDKIKLNENVPENEIWLVDFRYKGEKMNTYELNQEVKVRWPAWQLGNVGKVVDVFEGNIETFYVVDLGNGERYTYKECELEAINEIGNNTI